MRPFVGVDPGEPYGAAPARPFRAAGFNLRHSMRGRFAHTVVRLVRHGLGVAVIDEFAAAKVHRPQLLRRPLAEPAAVSASGAATARPHIPREGTMKRTLTGRAFSPGLAALPAAAENSERKIQGTIQWGAGGARGRVARAITPHADVVPSGKGAMQNVTGDFGAIGLNHVANADGDGHTLFFCAEGLLLSKVMGPGEKDCSDFVPIDIRARGVPIPAARPDAPFDTFPEMIDCNAANPGAVEFGSTGPGGLSRSRPHRSTPRLRLTCSSSPATATTWL